MAYGVQRSQTVHRYASEGNAANLEMSARQLMRCSKPLCRLSGRASFTACSAFVTADFRSLACMHTACFTCAAQQHCYSGP